jgi:excisionase family DNA binding protein
MVMVKEWFRIEEAAEYLCVSKRTIYKLTQEGRLPTFRIGRERHRRFRKEDLDKVPQVLKAAKDMDSILALSASVDPVLTELGVTKGMLPMTKCSRGDVVLISAITSRVD